MHGFLPQENGMEVMKGKGGTVEWHMPALQSCSALLRQWQAGGIWGHPLASYQHGHGMQYWVPTSKGYHSRCIQCHGRSMFPLSICMLGRRMIAVALLILNRGGETR
jgi:hypothetical protein